MASIWVESLDRSFGQALDLLAAAVRDCTDDLWETSMWLVRAPDPDRQFLSSDWNPVTDSAQRHALVERWVQRWSTPWSVAWHALEGLDHDLNGEFGPWAPPPPFTGHPHWRDLPSVPAAWSRSEMLAYINYCRERVRNTLAGMTDEKAATPLPRPAARMDHHRPRRAYDRARVTDPTIHHCRWDRARHAGPSLTPPQLAGQLNQRFGVLAIE